MPTEWAGDGGADDPAHSSTATPWATIAFSEADRLHLLAEATKAAYRVRDNFIAIPAQVPVDVEGLSVGGMGRARAPADPARPRLAGADAGTAARCIEDTVYLCVVDRDGNACSFINSLFSSFGSGIVAPESGVLLQNRGSGFRTIPGHPNAIAPRQAAVPHDHPGDAGQGRARGDAVRRHGRALPGGRPCAFPAPHARPRPRSAAGGRSAAQSSPFRGKLQVEPTNPEPIIADLARRGHEIEMQEVPLGGCQAIWIDHERGVLIGGSEPRKDGLALGY